MSRDVSSSPLHLTVQTGNGFESQHDLESMAVDFNLDLSGFSRRF